MKNLNAFETEAVIDSSASLRLIGLPFAAGDRVRVFVVGESVLAAHEHSDEELALSKTIREGQHPVPQRAEAPLDWRALRGTVLRYDDPTEPVGEEDWEALK